MPEPEKTTPLDPVAARKALPKSPSRFSASKILANLSPAAAFRRGRVSADGDVALGPEVEAHLCQLAMLENYADHGMYVKFSDDEATNLESKAFDLALVESKAAEEAQRSGKAPPSRTSSISSQAYNSVEAERMLAALRSDDDPLFSHIATPAASGRVPSTASLSSMQSSNTSAPNGVTNEGAGGPSTIQKVSSFSAFKKRLFPKRGAKHNKGQLPPLSAPANNLPYGEMGHGYSPGSYDHFAAEAAENGMEYCNGYVLPPDAFSDEEGKSNKAAELAKLEQERLERALALSAAQDRSHCSTNHEESDGALMAIAMQESRLQAEFDQVLRDAKMLRLDLRHEQERCKEKQKTLLAQRADLEARIARLSGKQKSPPHLTRQVAEAKHYAKEAGDRAAALGEGVEELGHLEAYVRTVKPPKEEAVALSEVIVRQLLERLNFLGFDFHVPAEQDQGGDIEEILAKYRQVNPAPPPALLKSSPAGTPAKRSPAASPLKVSPAGSPQVTLKATPQSTPRTDAAAKMSSTTAPAAPSQPATGGTAAQFDLKAVAQLPRASTATSSPQAPSTPVKQSTPGFKAATPSPKTPTPPILAKHSSAGQHVGSAATKAASLATQEDSAGAEPRAELKSSSSLTKASQRLQKVSSQPDKKGKETERSTTPQPWPSPPLRNSLEAERDPSIGRIRSLEDKQLRSTRFVQPINAKRSSQVVHLYNEMRKVLPDVMERYYAKPEPQALGWFSKTRASPAGKLAQEIEVSEAVKEDADKHSRVITKLGRMLGRAKPKSIEAACELVEDIETQLFAVKADLASVLSQSPDFPLAKWTALKEATGLYTELEEMGTRMQTWSLSRGGYQEEAMAMEMFFDTVRVRIDCIQAQVKDAEHQWAAAGITWDAASFKRCRSASLHIATLFMSRALFEVANLERSQSLKAQACINDLADAIRIAYKVHQFAGGFHSDANELFEKVKRLAQYYVRSRDPLWLKDTTKFS